MHREPEVLRSAPVADGAVLLSAGTSLLLALALLLLL